MTNLALLSANAFRVVWRTRVDAPSPFDTSIVATTSAVRPDTASPSILDSPSPTSDALRCPRFISAHTTVATPIAMSSTDESAARSSIAVASTFMTSSAEPVPAARLRRAVISNVSAVVRLVCAVQTSSDTACRVSIVAVVSATASRRVASTFRAVSMRASSPDAKASASSMRAVVSEAYASTI